MQNRVNAKKARAVVVTIALIVATNFAISRAESILVSNTLAAGNECIAPDAAGLQQSTSNASFAADAVIFQPAPRPSKTFAADAVIFQPAPRPS